MAAMARGDFYHRRLDRRPENAEFYLLPEGDRRLISNLRSSMDVTRDKITKLRDVVEDKGRDVSRESALRRAAEAKLEQLIDMYGDPAVMEELNERLTRAGRTDRKTRSTEELRDVSHTEEDGGVGGSRAFDRYWMKKRAAACEPVHLTTGHRSRSAERDPSTSRWHSRQQRSATFECDIALRRDRCGHRSHIPPRVSPPPSEPSQSTPPSHPAHLPYPSQQGFLAPFNMSPPYPVYMPSPAFPYLPPQMLYMPPMQGSAHYPGHDHAMTGSKPHAQSYPNTENTVVTTPVTSQNTAGLQTKPHRITSVSFAEKMNSTIAITPSQVTAEANIPTNIPASTTRSPSPGDNTTSPLSTTLSPRRQESCGSREQNRQISLLLAELDAAKELNVKLQSKLMTTERELESLKITCKLRDAEAETLATSKAAALVEEIYTAQKTHDEAMIGRMRTANEDRDEALLKLSKMDVHSDGYESGSDDYHGDKDIHRLLHQIDTADSSTKVIQHGDRIVDTINQKNQWKHRVVTEEMKAVLEERDVAVLKNRKLESELLRLQRQQHGRSSDNCHQDVAQGKSPAGRKELLAKLMATQQERDMAIGKMRKCQEELDKLRLYYNLHKSLSQEEHLRDDFNTKLEEIEGELRQREAVVEHARRVNAQLTEQLKASVAAKMKMADEVSKAMQTQKGAEANNERLERLVNVLRRKINGLGSKSEDY